MFITILGLVAAAFTTFSMFPQVIRIFKSKSTKDISLPMYIVLSIGCFLWLVYGLLIKSPPIYLANIISLIFSVSILVLKIKHG